MIRYVLFELLISLAGEEVCSAWFWNHFFALSKSACGGLVRRVRHFVQPWLIQRYTWSKKQHLIIPISPNTHDRCLTAPSHSLNQGWHVIHKVLCYLFKVKLCLKSRYQFPSYVWNLNIWNHIQIFQANKLTHWHDCGLVTSRHMVTKIWVNIGSSNGLVPDDTKPLPEPMLIYHQ